MSDEPISVRIARVKGWTKNIGGPWTMADGHSGIFGEPDFLTSAASFALLAEMGAAQLRVIITPMSDHFIVALLWQSACEWDTLCEADGATLEEAIALAWLAWKAQP